MDRKYTENEMDNLFKKYFEGETTREEELALYEYFCQESLPERFQDEQSFFLSLGRLGHYKQFLEDDLQKKIEKQIQKPKQQGLKYIVTFGSAIAGIAASLLIVFLLGKPVKERSYVMIDGVKYTDEKMIQQTINESFDNVKMEMEDLFSSFDYLDLE